MELLPALDLCGGGVVRLLQGDFARETAYSLDPLAQARSYAEGGARWLHVVDLDAARSGIPAHTGVIRRLVRESGLAVQVAGGIRDLATAEAWLTAGAARVVVGSAAVRQPAEVRRWISALGCDRVVLALDVDLAGRVQVAGWREDGGIALEDLLAQYDEFDELHLLCTAIDRDGTLAGPDLERYRRLLQLRPGVQLQASGGIGSLADLAALARLPVAGAVVGKALLDGLFTVAQALSASTAGASGTG